MSNSLSQELTIIEIGGENRIDSRIVAKSLEIEHHSLMATMYKYQDRIERLGAVPFQIEALKHGSYRGSSHIKYAMLNENQAIFVANLSRNTEQVVEFKFNLTVAFDEARKRNSRQYSITVSYERRRMLLVYNRL